MKDNFYKFFLLLSIVLFYYIFNKYNIFIYVVVLVLYLLFSNILSMIKLNNSRELFYSSLLSILWLNLVFIFLNLFIGVILSKIFYLSHSVMILFVLSFGYLIGPVVSIIFEYLSLNGYKIGNVKYFNYYRVLNLIMFIILSYINLDVLSLGVEISIIVSMIILIFFNYLFIFSMFRYIYRNFDNVIIYKDFNINSRIIVKFFYDNYNLFLIYISIVLLFYLLINRYYYSYIIASKMITKYCLVLAIILFIIEQFRFIKYNIKVILLGLMVKLISSLLFVDIFNRYMDNCIIGDAISIIISYLVVILLNKKFYLRKKSNLVLVMFGKKIGS